MPVLSERWKGLTRRDALRPDGVGLALASGLLSRRSVAATLGLVRKRDDTMVERRGFRQLGQARFTPLPTIRTIVGYGLSGGRDGRAPDGQPTLISVPGRYSATTWIDLRLGYGGACSSTSRQRA